MSVEIEKIEKLVANFKRQEATYIQASSCYNEESCRLEFIDKLFVAFGWDVGNEAGLSANTKEVVVEKAVENGKIPDYTFTLKGVSKFFVEAKKPSVDILSNKDTAFQARKYGWNANSVDALNAALSSCIGITVTEILEVLDGIKKEAK